MLALLTSLHVLLTPPLAAGAGAAVRDADPAD